MNDRISVTSIQGMSITSSLEHISSPSPMKCLFQIARRRRTSRIFTTTEVNTEIKLLISANLVLESHDETHSRASDDPKRHLPKGQVRQRNGFKLLYTTKTSQSMNNFKTNLEQQLTNLDAQALLKPDEVVTYIRYIHFR